MASEDLFTAELSEDIADKQDEKDELLLDVVEEEIETIAEVEVVEDAEVVEAADEKPSTANENAGQEARLFQLPLTRVKNLMKLDPDMNMVSTEAVFVVTRSTELFIESLAREAFSYTTQSKKKTMQKRDVDLAISSVDSLMFLDGAMNF